MATPSSTIALSDVNTELARTTNSVISLNDTTVRTLAGVASGTISMSDLRGKTNRKTLLYPVSSATNVSINITSISGYVAGKSDISITVNSGAVVYSTSSSVPALYITGASAGDTLTLVNNGTIVGCGGAGGQGGQVTSVTYNAVVSGTGGTALSAGCSFTITNNGIIGGGGGGGGGGAGGANTNDPGGGGGGGAGFGLGAQRLGANGTATAGGAGGNRGSGIGGAGGSLGVSGGGGGSYRWVLGSMAVTSFGATGGAAGAAIAKNGFTVTISGPGSTYGATSN